MSGITDQDVEREPRNYPFLIVKWYGYIMALMFVLAGGLKLILGALDRDYSEAPDSVIFLIEGLVLMGLCIGFRDRRAWGWYGLVGLNGVFVLFALIRIGLVYNLPFLIMSIVALILLFSRPVKAEIF